MPYKERTSFKVQWKIGEAAEEVGVATSCIRYWEKKFGKLFSFKNSHGHRIFRKKDLDKIRLIKRLAKDEGHTIKGVKRRLMLML